MQTYFLKTVILLCCSILAIISLWLPVAAQSDEEMRILALFYEEKDLVITPTRHPKPISQVAENITVVTAREIEAMNAHTVAEVLNRVPGLFVNFNQDFGATSLLSIQGSEPRHVLILVDGMPWNLLSEGSAETNSIPVGIIDRIEIIKGPASSAWGSSLGGVINILTKETGDTEKTTIFLRASYGESSTKDYRAQVSGRTGPVEYYLFAGRQDSDGLRDARYFDSHNLYAKLHIPISDDVEASLNMGYSDPHIKLADFPSQDITQTGSIRTFYTTASFEAFLARGLDLNLSFHRFTQKPILTSEALGLGMIGPQGELYQEIISDEETTGARGKLVWEKGGHTAVLGIDFDQGEIDQTLDVGTLLQSMGVPAASSTHPQIDKWAVYANDTIALGRWSVTPGIRYDHNNITGSFLSPSLGLTYRLGEESILRASVARGFTIPPLGSTLSGGLFLEPNPTLKPEEVWSFQAGLESAAAKYLWIKAILFRHDLDKALIREFFAAGPPSYNDLIVNDGKTRRQGLELEAQTLPFHHLSLLAGLSYVDISPSNETGSEGMYAYDIGLRYDDRKSFKAELSAHYIWWDADPAYNGSYEDFVWDLNLNKEVYALQNTTTKIFLTAHNLFRGSQYLYGDHKNPGRWLEAGIRIKF